MKCKSFSFSHRNAGIADVICHPMSQHSYFFHFSLLAFYQFIHFFLRFGQWIKTSIIFVHFIEPQRLVFPLGSGRHHQFGSCIEKVYHVWLFSERHHIIHRKAIFLATVFITHGWCALTLIELKLKFLLHRNAYYINFTYSRSAAPKRNNIIKLSAHRRNKAWLIFITCCKQRIGKAFLGYFVIHNITRLQGAHFNHDLSCAPINGTGRSSIITGFPDIKFIYFSIGTMDGYTFKFGISSQRVIIVFNHPIIHCSPRSLYLYHFAYSKRPLSCRLDRYQCTIQQCHTIGCFVSLPLRSLFIRFPALSQWRSRNKKAAKEWY